jgi:hypothetical protein
MQWKQVFILSLLVTGVTLNGYAQYESLPTAPYGGGVESIVDPDEQPAGYPYAVPPGMPPGTTPGMMQYYGQQYSPYPASPMVQQVQPARQPWYKKLFSPVTKRMNPPINREPKVPSELPKETYPTTDPLVRLAKEIVYEGKTVPPGFYLLVFKAGSNENEGTLTLFKQQKPLLTIPATVTLGGEPSSQADPNATIERHPIHAEKKQKQENAYKQPVSLGDPPPIYTAEVDLAEDGRSVILILQEKDRRWTSTPIAVSESMQPD